MTILLKSDHASWLAVSCDPNHLTYIDASSPSIDSLLNQLFQPSTSCVQDIRAVACTHSTSGPKPISSWTFCTVAVHLVHGFGSCTPNTKHQSQHLFSTRDNSTTMVPIDKGIADLELYDPEAQPCIQKLATNMVWIGLRCCEGGGT
jgi:hypothetical protein